MLYRRFSKNFNSLEAWIFYLQIWRLVYIFVDKKFGGKCFIRVGTGHRPLTGWSFYADVETVTRMSNGSAERSKW